MTVGGVHADPAAMLRRERGCAAWVVLWWRASARLCTGLRSARGREARSGCHRVVGGHGDVVEAGGEAVPEDGKQARWGLDVATTKTVAATSVRKVSAGGSASEATRAGVASLGRRQGMAKPLP